MRSRFDEQLTRLNQALIEMGAMCEEAIALAAKALMDGDPTLAGKAAPLAGEINRMERDIESMCLKLLLQQQPVARDLRLISAALKMITDMERIGRQAEDIAEIIPFVDGKTGVEFDYIGEMARESIHMVTESVNAFVRRDTNLAAQVMGYDDVVDGWFRKVREALTSLIAAHPENGGRALDLLMIAKYFERIGDHASNIAEWVVFSVTGEHKGENMV